MKMTCINCKKTFDADESTVNEFGTEIECMKCVDWKHVDFMAEFGRKLKMSCVKNCRCGFGK